MSENNNVDVKKNDAAEAEVAPSRTLWSDAWKRLKKNKLAMAGAIWIIFMLIIAVSAPLWAPSVLGDPTTADSATMTDRKSTRVNSSH